MRNGVLGIDPDPAESAYALVGSSDKRSAVAVYHLDVSHSLPAA